MNNDSDEKRRFSQNVKDTLAKKERRGCTFNAGNPHPVFIQKGMPDKPIRISPAVIRKARKHTKYNNHCVKQADMERLPDLLRNPAALLKSISKPNTFIVVLDAKDEKNLPVIAAIKSENDINEITSVYGRDNFENFIVRTNEAGAVLSVNKNKINEGVWA
jgi:hypothetical protein